MQRIQTQKPAFDESIYKGAYIKESNSIWVFGCCMTIVHFPASNIYRVSFAIGISNKSILQNSFVAVNWVSWSKKYAVENVKEGFGGNSNFRVDFAS
jgi:hypothetical protein